MSRVEENKGTDSYCRYLEGDTGAFDEIIHLYKKGLIVFIYRYVGDLDVAEDLSEDCFVELIVHPRKYKMKSGLKTYLYGIAHNKIKEYFRRKKIISFVHLESENVIFSYDNTGDDLLKSENERMLRRTLSELPKEYNEVLYLHYFEDLSYEEIGKVMGKKPKQVYNLAARAKKKLKEKLERSGYRHEE